MTGIFTGSALPGLIATFFSSRQGAFAATASIWTGFVSAVIVWITLAHRIYGEISVSSVGEIDPCLYGCIAGIAAASVVTIALSLVHNAQYDWRTLGAIRLLDDEDGERDLAVEDNAYDPERLKKAAYIARAITAFLFLALFIIWPLRYVSFLALFYTTEEIRTYTDKLVACMAQLTNSRRNSSLAGSSFLSYGPSSLSPQSLCTLSLRNAGRSGHGFKDSLARARSSMLSRLVWMGRVLMRREMQARAVCRELMFFPRRYRRDCLSHCKRYDL